MKDDSGPKKKDTLSLAHKRSKDLEKNVEKVRDITQDEIEGVAIYDTLLGIMSTTCFRSEVSLNFAKKLFLKNITEDEFELEHEKEYFRATVKYLQFCEDETTGKY